MNTRLLGLTAALALSITSVAMAQTVASPTITQGAVPTVAAKVVGEWLYDPRGNLIGSVRSVADGGSTAVIMIGVYFHPGSHEARVPARTLSIVDGKVTLQSETVQALNIPTQR